MKFRINHLLAFVAIVAVFLALRSAWISYEDDSIAGWAPLAVATIAGMYAAWCQLPYLSVFLASATAGFASSTSFALEMVLHSPPSLFFRHRIPEMYYDDLELNVFSVFVSTVICGVLGIISGAAVFRSRSWIVVNSFELFIIATAVAVSFGLGIFVHGLGVVDFVVRDRFVFGAVAIGSILAVAWVCSFRSFPHWPENAG